MKYTKEQQYQKLLPLQSYRLYVESMAEVRRQK